MLEVAIDFKVNQSWLSKNNFSKEKVKLNRFEGSVSGWKELETKKTDENATKVFYQAASPGFSFFAITSEKSEIVNETKTDMMEAEEKEMGEITGQAVAPEKRPLSVKMGIITTLTVVGLIVLVYFKFFGGMEKEQYRNIFRRNRKKINPNLKNDTDGKDSYRVKNKNF